MSPATLHLKDSGAALARLSTIRQAKKSGHDDKRRARQRMRAKLCELFPKAFPEGEPVPLKVGIRADLMVRLTPDPDVGIYRQWLTLTMVLRNYTDGKRYHRVMVAGAVRVDLDGNPAGEVSETDAAYSAQRLAELEQQEAVQ